MKKNWEKLKQIFKKELKIKQIKIIILFLIITAFAVYPYLNRIQPWGHDMSFHLNRIQSMTQELKNGNLPVQIYSQALQGTGYGSSLFYPELFLYIPAILNLITDGLIISYKFFILLITAATLLITYFSANKILKSKSKAVVTSLLYTFSLYRIEDVFVRAALGEILAFAFLPLVIAGIYEMIYGDKKNWWILALGLFGIANSHMISFVMAVGMILYFFIINIVKVWKEKRFKTAVICAIVSVLLSSSVFFVMLEQFSHSDYVVTKGGTNRILSAQAATISKLFQSELVTKTAQATDTDVVLTNTMNMGIGFILMAVAVLILFVKDKDKKQKQFMWITCILGIISIIMASKVFPWKYFSILGFIQFPWRMNMVSTLCMSIVGSYAIFNIFDKIDKKKLCIITSLIVLFVGSGYLENVECDPNGFSYEGLLAEMPIGAGEYLPIGYNSDNLNVTDESKTIIYEYTKENNKLEFEYTEDRLAQNGVINVPITYYYGYKAYVQDENGNMKNIKLEKNGWGLIKVINDQQLTGKIIVKYETTAIQKISYIITIIALICIVIYIVKVFKVNKINKEKTKKMLGGE